MADMNSLAKDWLDKVTKSKKAHKHFRAIAKDTEKQWLDPAQRDGKRQFNVLWANVSILHGALYSSTPKAEVRRRFVDSRPAENDPNKSAALCIERAIDYMVDTQDFDTQMDMCVDDYLVAGMGVPRVMYEPSFAEQPVIDEATGQPAIGEDGKPMTMRVIASQKVTIAAHPWAKFHWEPGNRRWEDVNWVCFEHDLHEDEVKEQFPKAKVEANSEHADPDQPQMVKVYELWDKRKREIVVFSEGVETGLLERRDDKLKVEGFYPIPRPMMANVRSKRLEPCADFHFYKGLAKEIELIEQRRKVLLNALRAKGFYDASMAAPMQDLEGAGDTQLVPVDKLLERLSDSSIADMSKVIAWWPTDMIAKVLAELTNQMQVLKDQMYEITGMSDIVRGASQASETATAQQIKGQWASVRLADKQGSVNECVRGVFRMAGEIISEHFEPDILAQMTGVEVTDEIMQIIRDDARRSFAVDVETDSTIARDQIEEKNQRLEMLTTVTEFINTALPAAQQGMITNQLASDLLLTTVRSYPHGRQLEESIQASVSQIDAMGQMQQQMAEMDQMGQQQHMQMQQMQQHIQHLEAMLAQSHEREQAREDLKAQSEARVAQADANEKMAEAGREAAHGNLYNAQAGKVAAETQAIQFPPVSVMPGSAMPM